jgi:hypothetical protein
VSITAGQRVETSDGAGYVYSIEHDWAGVILDRNAGRSNPPIFWVKLEELQQPTPAQPFNYWEAELSGIKTTGEDDPVKLKLRTSCSETKWLSLSPADFEAVEALLVERYAARVDSGQAPAQPANSLEGMQQEVNRRKGAAPYPGYLDYRS